MDEKAVTLTPDQFQKLIDEVRSPKSAAGLGAQPPKTGFGCPGGPNAQCVNEFLEAGSPRLALAKALGVPLAPYLINVRAEFPTTDTPDVPDVGSDVKVTQDTYCDGMQVRIINRGQSANENQFQTLSDFLYNYQSGIDATLDVFGAPRYAVAPRFMPLSNLMDVVNTKWPNSWILTYQQQLMMSFHASVTLPDAPMDVICTFRGWVPTSDMFVEMTNREAIRQLQALGYEISDAYIGRTSAR